MYIIFLQFCIVLVVNSAFFRYNYKDNSARRLNMNSTDLLLQTYDDLRSEIKQRITQRDSFAIQFVVTSLTIFTVALNNKICHTLLLLPIISLFYSSMILSSYRIHARLAEFTREHIELQLSKALAIEKPSEFFWESYCAKERAITLNNKIGIRKLFFSLILMCMPIITFILFTWQYKDISIIVFIYCIICELISFYLCYRDSSQISYTGLNKLAFCDWQDRKPRTDEEQKALFLDRDGTLHVDKVMTHRLRDLELLPGAKDIVKKAHNLGYKVIIVTNQSAIGKGYYSVACMHRFNRKLRHKLKYVDAIYYCPHKNEDDCNCKKPKTGMFIRAKKEFNINLSKSIIIGDRMSDIIAGNNAGIERKIFVTTGIYKDNDYETEQGFFDITHETVHSLEDIEIN